MSDYSAMTLTQLKEECKAQGLPVSGTKAVLVQRLTAAGGEATGGATEEKMEVETKSTKSAKRKAEDEDTESAPETKKKKGAAIKVDETCSLKGATVVGDWGAMLNQTNIGNNNNKFYVIQVLQVGSTYYCFNRWGRVSERGQNACKQCPSLEAAQKEFKKKFSEKTKNDWDVVMKDRSKFQTKPGLYTLLEMSYEDDDIEQIQEALGNLKEKHVASAKKIKPSALPKQTQELINLIFDLDMFKAQMAKYELNVKELPLGKLSITQINKGFAVLEKMSAAINSGNKKADFEALCNEFYTIIPHSFGRNKPTIFRDAESVQNKKDMLSVLSDIALAQDLTKEGEKKAAKEEVNEEYIDNPIDKNYALLKADIQPLDQESHEYEVIVNYLNATMGDWRKLQLLEVFKVTRESEPARFKACDQIVERKLLWHGTNVAVMVAILSTGLRIMPHSGGRVGKGIYFASENSKSAGYVGTTSDNVGFMFLNEVALGKQHIITKDDSSLRVAPKGFDSIVAKGWTEPDPAKDTVLKLDGHDVVVPQGKATKQPQYSTSSFSQTEYLIYNENQNQIRYLLKLKGF
jgi:poly [ADP-ribose] polymerase